ncbi:hypothetical protein [Kitasatospora griseola]|uniref:hypothetical protein n=1 Tax=Kitasatospora griseola TaxID=2064 RepID=UPI00382FE343
MRLDLGPDATLRTAPESVWIAAGRWEGDRFQSASDDVTVIFDRAEASRTAIMK